MIAALISVGIVCLVIGSVGTVGAMYLIARKAMRGMVGK